MISSNGNQGRWVLSALFYIFHILFFRNLSIFEMGFCFFYIGGILILPIQMNAIPLMIVGFCYGLAVDIFSDTYGIHAAATVFICFLRPFILQILRPSSGYEGDIPATPDLLGYQWFISYASILVFVHHLVVFSIEGSGQATIFKLLLNVFFTSIFTMIGVIFMMSLSSQKRKR